MPSKGHAIATLLNGGSGSGIPTESIANDAITSDKIADNIEFQGDYIKVPAGPESSRPDSATVGMLRYNTDNDAVEQYATGGWKAVEAPPIVSSVSPTDFDGNSGTQITLFGDGFKAGAQVYIVRDDGTEDLADTINIVSGTQITCETPRDYPLTDAPLGFKVVNGSGLSNTKPAALTAGNSPVFNTASGSLGEVLEGNSSSFSVSAADPDGGAVTYSVVSGELPSGLSIGSSNGSITGTANAIGATTNKTFTVRATDSAGNSTDRQFSINHINIKPIIIKLWSGGGGYNTKNAGCSGQQPGGGSAFVKITSSDQTISSGTTLTLYVAQGGGTASSGGWPGGGNGGSEGGKGGGVSYIMNGGTLVAAAGAGGGGGGGVGAPGGYPNGLDGSGFGGTQSAGGAPRTGGFGGGGSTSTAGSYLAGGLGSGCAGGGGGAGYYGGGGGVGDCGACAGGSGGGGSSYANPSYYESVTGESGSGTTPGGDDDPSWSSGIGVGGNPGGNGRISITVDGTETVYNYVGNSSQTFTVP
jgi:hypothetical protein